MTLCTFIIVCQCPKFDSLKKPFLTCFCNRYGNQKIDGYAHFK